MGYILMTIGFVLLLTFFVFAAAGRGSSDHDTQ
jgi:hypothetical protein